MKAAKVWDPRLEAFVESDNPALIWADIALRIGIPGGFDGRRYTFAYPVRPTAEFWGTVAEMADYCEQEVDPPKLS